MKSVLGPDGKPASPLGVFLEWSEKSWARADAGLQKSLEMAVYGDPAENRVEELRVSVLGEAARPEPVFSGLLAWLPDGEDDS